MPPSSAPATRLRWDPTVTAGNLLTAIAMGGALIIWGLRLEGTVSGHDRRIDTLEAERRRDNAETTAIREGAAGMRAQLEAQSAALLRIEQRLMQIRADAGAGRAIP